MPLRTSNRYDIRIFIVLIVILSVLIVSIWPLKDTVSYVALHSDCTELDNTYDGLVKVDCTNPAKEHIGFSTASRGDKGNNVNKVVFTFQPVPVNHASLLLLQTIKGVGPRLAQDIVEYREHYGTFANAEALKRIPGVGEKKARYLATQFSFD